jgi:hypothetical protein
VVGDLGPAVQGLVGQAEDFLRRRVEGQRVVALVAAAPAVADLAQLPGQGVLAGVIEFGGVVQHQQQARVLAHAPQRQLAVWLQHGPVGDPGVVAQPPHGLVAGGVVELGRQGALRVLRHLVGQFHQALAAPLVAELGCAEVAFPKAVRQHGGIHAAAPVPMSSAEKKAPHQDREKSD